MNNNQQSRWLCTNCHKISLWAKMLFDDQVTNSPVIQYGCPNCRHMNCMEYVDPRND